MCDLPGWHVRVRLDRPLLAIDYAYEALAEVPALPGPVSMATTYIAPIQVNKAVEIEK